MYKRQVLAYVGDVTLISFAVPLSLANNRSTARLMVLMLLVVLATLMLNLRGLMPLLPPDLLSHCTLLLPMPLVIFLFSMIMYTRQFSDGESVESFARAMTQEEVLGNSSVKAFSELQK